MAAVLQGSEFVNCERFIIDEMSMVDIILMKHLTDALSSRTRLIMVGDSDQLPSVGAGNVLKDIIDSHSIECIKLTEIFRQAKESMIVVNAHRVNNGEEPLLNDNDNDFFFVHRDDPMQLPDHSRFVRQAVTTILWIGWYNTDTSFNADQKILDRSSKFKYNSAKLFKPTIS